ncbi:uncharacterized protein BDW43DRAFT_312610 [Aspergillus alliaceus]|uniref:uncharacterized protein n=1 Tax=Petromyces alliaceus TaxID=209559 RepID=UPI0012A5813D|nr:uncharacterized protein BDW43DRAFT_312610 [Aspergillus alliaceus]KAB8231994.1 hypothetical protein BDW43DRAFT_312610 [Aspergillus alliaceus]
MAKTSIVVRVQLHDVDAGTSKQASVAPLDVDDLDAFKKQTLGEVRKLLIKESVLNSRQQQSAFCTNKGAEVRDKTVLSVYLGLQATENDSNPPTKTPNKEETMDKDGVETTAKEMPSANTANEFDIYLVTKPKTKREAPEKGFLTERLNVSVDNGKITIPEAKWKELESTFSKGDWQASADSYTYPSEMTEQDWNRVIRNNSLMSGNVFSIVEKKDKNKNTEGYIANVDKAPYPAFKLLPRTFERYELDTKPDIDANPKYYMPRYLIADDSYVDVFETANAISSSLASSSFSQTDIEGSIGGGAAGFSAEVKAGFSKGTQDAISSATSHESRVMNISYNFPRVWVYLDKWSVELTDKCAEDLKAIDSQFFARRVELGGRLFSSESSSNISGSSASEKANRMKVAASASFSSPYVQASASASHQTETTDKEAQAQSRLNKSISWRAQGGNTLLANNPPAWCSTVGPYQNWRIVQQADACSMLDFIRTLSPEWRATVDEKEKFRESRDPNTWIEQNTEDSDIDSSHRDPEQPAVWYHIVVETAPSF